MAFQIRTPPQFLFDFNKELRNPASMVTLAISELPEFLLRRPFSIIHIDANWDGYREPLANRLGSYESRHETRISFGYMDCDDPLTSDYFKTIGIINVPSVAYYSGSTLFGVVIGGQQDIQENIKRLFNGQALDQTNTSSRK